MTPRTIARLAFVAVAGAELVGAQRRFAARQELFAAAQARATATKRPLVVIGDPHGAHTRLLPAYGCGDLTLDLTGCPSCPNMYFLTREGNLDRDLDRLATPLGGGEFDTQPMLDVLNEAMGLVDVWLLAGGAQSA